MVLGSTMIRCKHFNSEVPCRMCIEEIEKEFYSRNHFPRTEKSMEEMLDAMLKIARGV